jgi:hypothetical protein
VRLRLRQLSAGLRHLARRLDDRRLRYRLPRFLITGIFLGCLALLALKAT